MCSELTVRTVGTADLRSVEYPTHIDLGLSAVLSMFTIHFHLHDRERQVLAVAIL